VLLTSDTLSIFSGSLKVLHLFDFVRDRLLPGIPDGRAVLELRSDMGVVGLFFDFLLFLLMNHNELFAFVIMIFKILADCNT
jgi:hypothetical protein